MTCTEAYKEYIMYSFNGFCKTVLRFAAINAWRDRSRRRQKEISPWEYLTDAHFGHLGNGHKPIPALTPNSPLRSTGVKVAPLPKSKKKEVLWFPTILPLKSSCTFAASPFYSHSHSCHHSAERILKPVSSLQRTAPPIPHDH